MGAKDTLARALYIQVLGEGKVALEARPAATHWRCRLQKWRGLANCSYTSSGIRNSTISPSSYSNYTDTQRSHKWSYNLSHVML